MVSQSGGSADVPDDSPNPSANPREKIRKFVGLRNSGSLSRSLKEDLRSACGVARVANHGHGAEVPRPGDSRIGSRSDPGTGRTVSNSEPTPTVAGAMRNLELGSTQWLGVRHDMPGLDAGAGTRGPYRAAADKVETD